MKGEPRLVKHITPFGLEPVLEDKKLLCLEAWDGYLFAGLSDGSLLLITNLAAPGEPARWAVRDAVRSFAKRHVSQLVVAHSKAMLLSLTEEGVSAHVLPSLRLKAQALRTKGASVFSWDDATGTLIVAVKRRLLVFKYDGLEIVEQREVSLPDSVHSMQLVGPTAYIGLRQEYVSIDVLTGTLTQLFASRAPHTSCTAVPFILPPTAARAAAAQGGALVASAGSLAASESAGAAGAAGAGVAAAAAPGTPAGVAGALLTRDAQSVLMGPDGRLSRRGGSVSWSGTPRVVAVSGPYAVAGLEPATAGAAGAPAEGAGAGAPLEVRLLEPLSSSELLQRLELPAPTPAPAPGPAGGAGASGEDVAAPAPAPVPASTASSWAPWGLGGGGEAAAPAAAAAAPAVVDVVAPSPARDGSLFVGCKTTGAVVRLVPAPSLQQAAEMLRLEEYEEALYLCSLIPQEQAEAGHAMRDQIHLRYGQQLFGQGRYEEALAHFGQSVLAGPIQLLALFPSLAPTRLLQAAADAAGVPMPAPPVPEPEGEEYTRAVSTVLPYLLSYRSRLAAGASTDSLAAPAPAGDAAGQRAVLQAQPSWLEPPRELLQRQDAQRPLEAASAPESSSSSSSSHLDGSSSDEDEEGAGGAAPARARGGRAPAGASNGARPGTPLEVLLDTAVLRVLLVLPDSGALLRYVQRPSWVDLEAGEAALREAGRYSELVALYQGKGRHSAALELLQALSQAPSQLPTPPKGAAAELRGLPGVWAAVRYLSFLEAPRDINLITTHAKWVLAADPDAGLEMFSSMEPPMPPSDVLPILTSYAPHLAGSYLEAALASGRAQRERYEHELAVLYLLRVVHLQQQAGQQEQAQRQEGAGEASELQRVPEYQKLKALILSSQYVDCEALLRVLPSSRLLELRAVLLERLGRHLEALRIYVHQLKQLDLAEAYCDRAYQARQASKRAARLRGKSGGGSSARSGSRVGGSGLPAWQWGAAGGGWGANGAGAGRAAAGAGRPGGAAAARGEAGDFDIYLLLIQVILEEAAPGTGEYRLVERAPEDERWAEVARLLSRKRDAISPLRALELLPGALPLPSALPFLEGALWGAGEARRAGALGRALRRGEHVQLLGELAQERQASILLTQERGCSLCYKRIGTSAFVAFPSGLLAHFSCYRRSSTSASDGGNR